ncbi:DUF4097 family beta strand repeat-containing protein [Streptomyces hydrogenans]|uniref:DUF4097 family beta strand repeat-containing protein n=1 Tax=Streptomyces hydrogenans TaxID=1873719 RepID=UPI00278C6C2F|nr:DUF4097 family beta strand repeat-containing protein [Streptomyces hydrogenans]
MQKFATTAPIAAVVAVPAGQLRFIAADRADVTVEVRPSNAGRSRDVKAAEETSVSFADGVLRVAAPEARNQLFGQTGSVEITVQLPAGSSLDVKAAAADLRGVGRLGNVVFEAAQGPVKLDEAGDVRVTLQDGGIAVGRLNGSAALTTARGDLSVAEAVRGSVVLDTKAGSITVGAARGTSAVLDAGSTLGRINNTLHNAQGSGAELTIRATTALGDITAHAN